MSALKLVRETSFAVLLLGSAGLSMAQEADQTVPLRKKTIITDPYAASGIGTPALRLYPSLEIGTFITSNVEAAASNAKSDIGLVLKPKLRFASDWSRHAWTGSASADLLRYVGTPKLSTVSGTAETAFRLDMRNTTHADFGTSYHLASTGSGSGQLPSSASGPRHDQTFAVSAGLTHDFGGLEASVKTALERGLYSDVALNGGGTEVNADRNYWAPSLTLRAGLTDRGSALNPFSEITYQPRFHDQTIDRNGLKRNSQGLALTAGVAFARGPIWEGEVALTYLVRSFADPTLKVGQALGVKSQLTWRPTELTSVEATTGVGLDDSSTLGVSSTRNWNAGLNLTYSLRENIDVLAGLGLTVQNSGTQYDLKTTTNLGVNWKVNPNMTAGLNYSGSWFNSGAANGDYNEQRVMTSIVLKR